MHRLSSCVLFQPPQQFLATGWPATPAPAVPTRHARIWPMNHLLPTWPNHTNHMHIISVSIVSDLPGLYIKVVPFQHTKVSCSIPSLHRCGRKIICLSRLGTGERSHPESLGRTPVRLDSTNGIRSLQLSWSWYYDCPCDDIVDSVFYVENDSLKHSWHGLHQTIFKNCWVWF